MVTSQAPRSRPCQVKLPMRLSARRKVSEVRSSASWPVADPEVDEPEDRVDVAVVEQAERLGLAGLGPLDQRPDLGRGTSEGSGRLGWPVAGAAVPGAPVVLSAGRQPDDGGGGVGGERGDDRRGVGGDLPGCCAVPSATTAGGSAVTWAETAGHDGRVALGRLAGVSGRSASAVHRAALPRIHRPRRCCDQGARPAVGAGCGRGVGGSWRRDRLRARAAAAALARRGRQSPPSCAAALRRPAGRAALGAGCWPGWPAKPKLVTGRPPPWPSGRAARGRVPAGQRAAGCDDVHRNPATSSRG